MKKKLNPCAATFWVSLIIGLILVALAAGADALGVDQDLRWGPFRLGLMVLGLSGICLPLLNRGLEMLDGRLLQRKESHANPPESALDLTQARTTGGMRVPSDPGGAEQASRLDSGVRGSSEADSSGQPGTGIPGGTGILSRSGWAKLVVALILVEVLYVGLASVWNWTKWPKSTARYAMLAESFSRGQVSLPMEPSPLLAELENPYSPAQRGKIPAKGDLSYYHGKYYMYWGPVPSAIMALGLLIGAGPVGDEVVTFVAVSGIFVFLALSLVLLRRMYFPLLPSWLLWLGILVVATSHPMLWALNSPSVYMGAVASGQAFLVASVFFALSLMSEAEHRLWKSAAVGMLCSLALGSRAALLPAVSVLGLGVFAVILGEARHAADRPRAVKFMIALVLPLVIGCGMLGVYNFARFGNIYETGFQYQINLNDLRQQIADGLVLNPVYLLPNLLYYLVAPVRFVGTFPFLRPVWGPYPPFEAFLNRLSLPEFHGVESVAGLAFAMPSLVLVVMLLGDLSCGPGPIGRRSPTSTSAPSGSKSRRVPDLRWVVLTAILMGLAAAAPTFLYSYVSTRFLLDAIPMFALLTVVGAWQLHLRWRIFPLRGPLSTAMIFSLVAISAGVSFVLALSGADSRFDDANPALFGFLVRLFSGR